VPRGTPSEIIDKLYRVNREILNANQEAFKNTLLKLEAIPTLMDPKSYFDLCRADKDYFFKMVPEIKKELGVRD
jgi:hypothetical protein